MAIAPVSFGDLGGSLLVANFGDGRINAFNAATGAPIGPLADATATPIAIPGLRGLLFGNGGNGGQPDELFFTAGIPGGGSVGDHGLLGKLTAVGAGPAAIDVPTLAPGMAGALALFLASAATIVIVRRRPAR